MALVSALLEILQRPTIVGVLAELVMFMAPIWVAVIVGVLVGWAWKPKWADMGREMLGYTKQKHSFPGFNLLKFQLPGCISWTADDEDEKKSFSVPPPVHSDCSSLQLGTENPNVVSGDDLEHLCRIVEEKDGGPAWIQMMNRSTPTMAYKAWRRDAPTGPPQYRSSTIYEDATPEVLRDFFWDDEFRAKWDDMLIHASTLETTPTTGTMVVRWVRKFPFFCSDREYIIGRRIWQSGQSYYCVTKGIPNSVPRHNKPRRVDLYYSSWCIRPVNSSRGDGQLTACEVLLFHHEDMGIPWEIAKLGVRQGMWGAVKKIEPGLRAYQKERTLGATLSPSAAIAQINTKVSADYLSTLDSTTTESSELEAPNSPKKPARKNLPKLLIAGGAIALACSLDRGLLTKAVIFGVARRFAKVDRRL